MNKLIFNSSMPRSGSELLQVILSQHPEVYASPTSPLLEFQFAARGNMILPEVQSQDKELMSKAFLSMCGGMAKSYYEAITPKPLVVDKNRGWAHFYEWVEMWCADPKMLCMVRDPRAVIWSFEQVYRKNRHLPAGPDNPAVMANMTFLQRTQHWLTNPPFGLAMQRVQDSFQRGLDAKLHFIRFEDLLSSPQETMNAVSDYADIPRHGYDFGKLEKVVVEDASVFGVYGDHSVQSELDPSKASEWKSHLPVEVSDYILEQTKWFMRQFNYV